MKNPQPQPSTALTVAQSAAVSPYEGDALSTAAVLRQVALIQEIMQATMKDGEHYGRIPGCGDRPTLLKPGAEKLCFTFRLAPSYTVHETNFERGHREYRITAKLTSIVSGAMMGEGVGICSTLEGKYRFRKSAGEATDKPVPRQYWDLRAEDPKKAQELLGGKGFSPKKVDGKGWMIAKGGAQEEHDNPADHFNTVLKMAKKRALVDAVLTATAASDLFTQDLEDIRDAQAYFTDAAPAPAALPAQAEAPSARPAPQTASEGQDSGSGKDGRKSAPSASPEAQEDLPSWETLPPAGSDPVPPTGEPVGLPVSAMGEGHGRFPAWRSVRMHFGKNRGLLLEELNAPQLEWYARDWRKKHEARRKQGEAVSAEDIRLHEALTEWERCAVLTNAIGVRCDGRGFPEQKVADIVCEQLDIERRPLAGFTEESLRMILDNFDAISLDLVAPGA